MWSLWLPAVEPIQKSENKKEDQRNTCLVPRLFPIQAGSFLFAAWRWAGANRVASVDASVFSLAFIHPPPATSFFVLPARAEAALSLLL